jgi:hypothetical protein
VGTTKDTITKVRDRTHWNSDNIKPHNPVMAGLCKQSDLDAALKRAQRRVVREQKKAGTTPQPAPEDPILPQQNNETDPGSQEQPEIDPDAMFRGMS